LVALHSRYAPAVIMASGRPSRQSASWFFNVAIKQPIKATLGCDCRSATYGPSRSINLMSLTRYASYLECVPASEFQCGAFTRFDILSEYLPSIRELRIPCVNLLYTKEVSRCPIKRRACGGSPLGEMPLIS
jgi:hypothetical protein